MSTASRRAKEVPEELVIEILLRVPAIDLLRFRCVCKSWCALISNHDFITKHLKLSTLNEDTHHLLVHRLDKTTYDYVLNMLSFQTLDVLKTLPVPFFEVESIDRKSRRINILASCNGVICLEDDWGFNIVLWNPTTRETKIVPKPLPLPPGTWSNTNDRGFGFDAKTNDYKIVKISRFLYKDDPRHCNEFQVEVYSLRSDSWRTIDASVPATFNYGLFRLCDLWLYTNGMFSWWNRGVSDTLVSFDMSNEVFLTTPLPDGAKDFYGFEIIFFVRDESVALVVCIEDDDEGNVKHFDIWVLCQYGVKESWTKLLTVGPLLGIDWPLGFWKNGHVFLRTSEGQLVLYDPVSQDIKYLQLDGVPDSIQLTTYMESLVSIKGGS